MAIIPEKEYINTIITKLYSLKTNFVTMATAKNPTPVEAALGRCGFWHANRYRIWITCDTGMSGDRVTARKDIIAKHSHFSAGGRWLDQKR